jgi:hypothetical protein
MCDYSLQAIRSRPARVGEDLLVYDFGTGTKGFAPATVSITDPGACAVCLTPGTEIEINGQVAIFRQVDKAMERTHHDALEYPAGEMMLLTHHRVGLRARVLQLPAPPVSKKEREEQKRAAYAG